MPAVSFNKFSNQFEVFLLRFCLNLAYASHSWLVAWWSFSCLSLQPIFFFFFKHGVYYAHVTSKRSPVGQLKTSHFSCTKPCHLLNPSFSSKEKNEINKRKTPCSEIFIYIGCHTDFPSTIVVNYVYLYCLSYKFDTQDPHYLILSKLYIVFSRFRNST